MKSFKEVERDRIRYHDDAAKNSVHRSSLIVPEIDGAIAEISFLNHFLLKRKYEHVACKITGIDKSGQPIEARLFPIREPRVYVFTLTAMFPPSVASYLIEFYASENLFIPFPAVMVNHRGPGFFNSVHAYNRVLNDVFENDAINSLVRPEASIDVSGRDDLDSFFVFTAGPTGCKAELDVEFVTRSHTTHSARVPVHVPRFCHDVISLARVLPELPKGTPGILRIKQPSQFLFYGRLLVGIRANDGAFSANHSYYDSSDVDEFWDDDRSSYRLFPFFSGQKNGIRMYPIMSPGRLMITIDLHDHDGQKLRGAELGSLVSPGDDYLDVDVANFAKGLGVDAGMIGSFAVWARPIDGKTPTRVNHQLVHGAGRLESSINVSLANPNVFVPPKKTGLTWAQLPVGEELLTKVGFVGAAPFGTNDELVLEFYGEGGHIKTIERPLPVGGAAIIDVRRDVQEAADMNGYIWVMARCRRADLTAFVVTQHLSTLHCTGEHGF